MYLKKHWHFHAFDARWVLTPEHAHFPPYNIAHFSYHIVLPSSRDPTRFTNHLLLHSSSPVNTAELHLLVHGSVTVVRVELTLCGASRSNCTRKILLDGFEQDGRSCNARGNNAGGDRVGMFMWVQ